MARASENQERDGNNRDEPQAAVGGGGSAGQGAPQPQIELDDSRAVASYANFCRVTGTPEEVLIDFGLNEHHYGKSAPTLPIAQRIIMNYYTAKRLMQLLHMTVERYEATFGFVETDVQKRVRPAAGRPAPPSL